MFGGLNFVHFRRLTFQLLVILEETQRIGNTVGGGVSISSSW